MLFPKKLIPNTESDILKEISNELGIPLKDVKKTYNIWIEYIENIVKNTNQSVINFSGLGKMYLSYARLKGNKDKEWGYKKIEKIENDIPKDKNNDHKTTVPISIVYGVGRKNYKKFLLREYKEVYRDKADLYFCFYKKSIDQDFFNLIVWSSKCSSDNVYKFTKLLIEPPCDCGVTLNTQITESHPLRPTSTAST